MANRIEGEPQLPGELVPRAQRYDLQLPLWYRYAGKGDWHLGRTENMSRSGVLFEAEAGSPIPASTRVEIGLVLMQGATVPQVLCDAEIVRMAPGSAKTHSAELAARIWDYRFVAAATTGGPVA